MTVKLLLGGTDSVDVDKEPDRCPVCHRHVTPIYRSHRGYIATDTRRKLDVFFSCPSTACQAGFLASFVAVAQGFSHSHFALTGLAPVTPRKPQVPVEVGAVSPAYVEILAQAAAAESHGLDEVCGVGYRKALEFLIKDFAIQLKPDKTEEIKAAFLGVCIDKYVDDGNVKECARRATWLGNDETHYVRKWGTKDLNDLKQLIRLTEGWILSTLLTKGYLDGMPK